VTYVITDACVDVKDTSCMEVCPVACISDSGPMLVINPAECVDCGACEPECPVEAIYYEADLPADKHSFLAVNAAFFAESA
jgi:NAD-dependent dihydropyrimidine dehydrogenase PreA subunit